MPLQWTAASVGGVNRPIIYTVVEDEMVDRKTVKANFLSEMLLLT